MNLATLVRHPLLWPSYAIVLALLVSTYQHAALEIGLNVHDAETFSDNLAISQDFSFFFSGAKAQPSGRPLAELAKWLAYLVGGNQPAFFHCLALATHWLASLLLVACCLKLEINRRASALAGLLFLLNASAGNVLHFISSWDYALAMLFGLAAMLAYLRWWDTPGDTRWLLPAMAGLLAALACHGAMGFIALWALYHAWRRGLSFRRLLTYGIPLTALGGLAAFALLLWTARGTTIWSSVKLLEAAGPLNFVVGASQLLLWYVGRLAASAHWILLPLYEQTTAELALGGALVALLLFLLWRTAPPAESCIVWILLALFPFLLLAPEKVVPYPLQITRYLYWASAGTSVLLALLLDRLAQWLGAKLPLRGHWLLLGFTGLLLISSYLAAQNTMALSHYVSARHYFGLDQHRSAALQLEAASALDPTALPPEEALQLSQWLRLRLYPDTVPVEALIDEWQAMVHQHPASHAAHYFLGMAYRHYLNDSNQSLVHLQRALELGPDVDRILFALGEANRQVGNDQEALRCWSRLVEVVPDKAEYAYNLGHLYFHTLRQEEQGVAYMRQAAALDPDYPRAHHGIGLYHFKRGQMDQAILAWERFAQLAPKDFRAFRNLGTAYQAAGRHADAAHAFRQTLELKDDDGPSHMLLGLIYRDQLAVPDRARLHLERFVGLLPDHPNAAQIRQWLAAKTNDH